jgi:hypothetical protein
MDYLHLRLPPALTVLYAEQVDSSLRVTRLLVGVWCLLSTLELIANFDMFKPDGLLSWRILSLRSGLIFRSGWLQSLFWERSMPFVLGIRIAAAIGLLLTPNAAWACAALAAIVLTSWFLTMRCWLGGDGADEIGQIVSIGALLMAAGLASGQLGLSFAGTLLVAGQLTISYFFAGLSKLLSAEWRDGRALVGVMGTHSYGHALAARAVSRSPMLPAAACWLVILCETLFPVALVAPHSMLVPILTAFLLFHVSHAYFMGLNTFAWAFASAYPSFVVLNGLTTRALGLS